MPRHAVAAHIAAAMALGCRQLQVAVSAFEALVRAPPRILDQKGAAVDIRVSGPDIEGGARILTVEALDFVVALQRAFGAQRDTLLAARQASRAEVARTGRLDFLEETAHVRGSEWQVAPAPVDLQDRGVEMTGPTDRKMTINALNSGAQVWLADLEDASTPHWRNVVGGQVNLFDAVRRDISFTSLEGKEYAVRSGEGLPAIVVRPRGWHLDEKHLTVDGAPVVGALVDFGPYFFHNAHELLRDHVLGDRPNQIDRQRAGVRVTAEDLLDLSSVPGTVTRAGLHGNVEVALLYLEAWLRGNGAVGIDNLMEDAATAEISRSQIWQWIRNGTRFEDGALVTEDLVRQVLDEAMAAINSGLGGDVDSRRFTQARDLFEDVALADDFVDFLTLPAYDAVVGS